MKGGARNKVPVKYVGRMGMPPRPGRYLLRVGSRHRRGQPAAGFNSKTLSEFFADVTQTPAAEATEAVAWESFLHRSVPKSVVVSRLLIFFTIPNSTNLNGPIEYNTQSPNPLKSLSQLIILPMHAHFGTS